VHTQIVLFTYQIFIDSKNSIVGNMGILTNQGTVQAEMTIDFLHNIMTAINN
jgi:hypothetical protein